MAEIDHGVPQPDNPDVHHETSDVNVRVILWFAFWFVVAAIAIHVLIWGVYRLFSAITESRQGPPISRVSSGPRVPPEPRLQILGANPVVEMRRLRDQEDRILGSYGLMDRATGAVRIPIEDAMKIAAQRPEMFPVRAPVPPAVVAPSDSSAPASVVTPAPVSGTGLPPQGRPVDEPEQFPRQVRPQTQEPRL
jgi:hypothetical protein